MFSTTSIKSGHLYGWRRLVFKIAFPPLIWNTGQCAYWRYLIIKWEERKQSFPSTILQSTADLWLFTCISVYKSSNSLFPASAALGICLNCKHSTSFLLVFTLTLKSLTQVHFKMRFSKWKRKAVKNRVGVTTSDWPFKNPCGAVSNNVITPVAVTVEALFRTRLTGNCWLHL